ncbi:hypothetical protein FACS1894110_22160 [Spirochaetia bacterium]|nr:hypothetical protein FACS1894110_22160 [Spirochaetia bacterium]
MKKLVVISIVSLLMLCCVKNNNDTINLIKDIDKTKNEDIVLDIWPSPNRLELSFYYNGDTYKIKFIGKEKYMAIASIEINNNPFNSDEQAGIVLNDGEVILINEELKKIISQNEYSENDLAINLKYKIYHHEWLQDGSYNSSVEYKEYTTIASDRLKEFLINRLLYINSLPLYKVEYNDTLIKICLKFFGDTNYERIVDVNQGMTWGNQYLVVGPNDKIRIPEK